MWARLRAVRSCLLRRLNDGRVPDSSVRVPTDEVFVYEPAIRRRPKRDSSRRDLSSALAPMREERRRSHASDAMIVI